MAAPSDPSVPGQEVLQVPHGETLASSDTTLQSGIALNGADQKPQSDLGRDLFDLGVSINRVLAEMVASRDVFLRR